MWPVTREAAKETVRAAPVAASATPREATGAKASHPRRRKRQLTTSWYSVKTILAVTRATTRESVLVFNHSERELAAVSIALSTCLRVRWGSLRCGRRSLCQSSLKADDDDGSWMEGLL